MIFNEDENGIWKRDSVANEEDETRPLFGSDTEKDDAPIEDSFYAILNVPKDASSEQITRRYRALAIELHPDKHTQNPQMHAIASAKFQQIQKAYEVLSDPMKKTVYDMFGEEGLQHSWEVGSKYKSAEELRAYILKSAKELQIENLENLTKSKGNISCNIDARDVVYPYELVIVPDGEIPPLASLKERLSRYQIQSLTVGHGFEVPLNESTTASIYGSTSAYYNSHSTSLKARINHYYSKNLELQVDKAILKPNTTFKAVYSPDTDTFFQLIAASKSIQLPPLLSITCGQNISHNVTGFATYRTGPWSLGPWGADLVMKKSPSFDIGFTSVKGWQMRVETGILEKSISASRVWKKIPGLGIKIEAGGSVNSFGEAETHISTARKLTEHSKLRFSLNLGLTGGVAIQIGFSRLGQNINVPVLLSDDPDLSLTLSLLAVPLGSLYVFETFYNQSKRRSRLKKKLSSLRNRPDNADFSSKLRSEAIEYVNLMKPTYEIRVRDEQNISGLIIQLAIYGEWDDSEFESLLARTIDNHEEAKQKESTVINVTIPIQLLVSNSVLMIPGGRSKSGLLGFCDPSLGSIEKRLYVRYLFKNRLHQVTVFDKSPLSAPLQSHIV